MDSKKLKVLLVDIETAPTIACMWGMYQELTNYSFIIRDWYILCWAAKWLGEKGVISSALIDFSKEYKADKENDRFILDKLWKLLDEADVVVGHNVNEFDAKKINARFIIHGMKPPSPYRTVDTLQVCRKHFSFTSNKLNDVSQMLKLGEKVDTGGFKLWKQCIEGDKISWGKMVKYCKNDIILLEKVYLKLRPYTIQHPNMVVGMGLSEACCPKCGSDKIHYRGYIFTNLAKYRKFSCTECGGWGRERINDLTKEERVSLQVSA